MGIDLAVVRDNIVLILAAALAVTALKAGIIYVLFGPTCGHRADAIRAGSVLTAAGEFAFVLLPLGAGLALLSAKEASIVAAIAAITMLLGPLVATWTEKLLRRAPKSEQEADDFSDASGVGADRRLRPLRADRVAMPALAGRRCHGDRRRFRNDRRRRRGSDSRSITATARGSTCCAPPAPGRSR